MPALGSGLVFSAAALHLPIAGSKDPYSFTSITTEYLGNEKGHRLLLFSE
jgi:hypothetical protein